MKEVFVVQYSRTHGKHRAAQTVCCAYDMPEQSVKMAADVST
jgi:hypothetical protein